MISGLPLNSNGYAGEKTILRRRLLRHARDKRLYLIVQPRAHGLPAPVRALRDNGDG